MKQKKKSPGKKGRASLKRAFPKSVKKFADPRTVEEFYAMDRRSRDIYGFVTNAISRMKDDEISLPRAAAEFGVSRLEMLRFGGRALRKKKNGRYAAKTRDSLLRVLVIPTSQGLIEIGVRDSRQASRVGKYWAAVEKYLQTGDASRLQEFAREDIVDAAGKRLPLLTDLAELDRLGSAGVLSFESIYASVA